MKLFVCGRSVPKFLHHYHLVSSDHEHAVETVIFFLLLQKIRWDGYIREYV